MSKRVSADGFGPSKERRVFSQRLMDKLKEQNMSGGELARRANISRDAVSSYTAMRSIPTAETLAKIAKALRCKTKDLLPPISGDEADTIIEVREHGTPGMKLLIARVPLPADFAMEYAVALTKKQPPPKEAKKR